MANDLEYTRYAKIEDKDWPKPSTYKNMNRIQLAQETGRDLVSITNAASQLEATIDMFSMHSLFTSELRIKYETNGLYLPQMLIKSITAQVQYLMQPALRAAKECVEGKNADAGSLNILDDIFQIKGRKMKGVTPWVEPGKIGVRVARMIDILKDAEEAVWSLLDCTKSLENFASLNGFDESLKTKFYPTRPARELLLELVIREKLGEASEDNLKQLVSASTVLDLNYGFQSASNVTIDPKVFNDNLSPKMYFVCIDKKGSDWTIASTQPSCGKWALHMHVFMEKIRNIQLGEGYAKLYQHSQQQLQQVEQAVHESMKDQNNSKPSNEQSLPREVLAHARKQTVQVFHSDPACLGMFGWQGIALLRDLSPEKNCYRCQSVHGYGEVMHFEEARSLDHYRTYQWGDRVKKAHSCAEAATALLGALKRKTADQDMWEHK